MTASNARTQWLTLAGLVLLSSQSGAAGMMQMGDKPGEEQAPLPADLVVPAAPALNIAQALAGFALQPGLVIECVASEPLISDPVSAQFDGEGRLWVVEMRGYMPNIDGIGEDEACGTIAILTDRDGDGVMDHRTNFMEELILPRGLALAGNGAIVITPPNVVYAEDTDGDGKADQFEVIFSGTGGIHSPEHATNGPVLGLDNWYRFANSKEEIRLIDGNWARRRSAGGGQWGLTKDDDGRFFFNTNSDPLRGDFIPSHYSTRNPAHGVGWGVNKRLVKDHAVWPSRITPGINRGYKPHMLKDFKLTRFTGACGPLILRGHGLRESDYGTAFVAEPCGNLVKQFSLEEREDATLVGDNILQGREFLTSTDERFRPVNLIDGPDGALYIVDMYRGVIQHKIFVTSFLRRQVEERGLETPIGKGRIWRVSKVGQESSGPGKLSEKSWGELAELLSHPSGWVRDSAQRIIVAEGLDDLDAIETVRQAFGSSEFALCRVHALWTLEGIGGMKLGIIKKALADEDARVRQAGMRVCEPWLATGAEEMTRTVARLGSGGTIQERLQAIHSLGDASTRLGDRLLAELITSSSAASSERSAVLTGLAQREFLFLQQLAANSEWESEEPGRSKFLVSLSRAVGRQGVAAQIEGVLQLIVDRETPSPWWSDALLSGLLASRPKGPDGKPAYLALSSESPLVSRLPKLSTEERAGRGTELADSLSWPGRTGLRNFDVRPLSDAEQDLFDKGEEIYRTICSQCHQHSGSGEGGKAPPLRYSEWVLGDPDRLSALVVLGLQGPIRVKGQEWNMEMPAYGESNENVAAVLTYIRRQWGHGADPVGPGDVDRVRRGLGDRTQAWTGKTLEEAFPVK